MTAASCEVGFKVYKVALPMPEPFATPSPTPLPAKVPVEPKVPAKPLTPRVPAVTKAPAGGARSSPPLGKAPAERTRRPRAGPDGCSVLPAGTPVRQRFPPYSDEVCDVDYTLCEADSDCGKGPDGKRMSCVPMPGCSASRCGRMVVTSSRTSCQGAGRCSRDCRQNVGVCSPVFCA